MRGEKLQLCFLLSSLASSDKQDPSARGIFGSVASRRPPPCETYYSIPLRVLLGIPSSAAGLWYTRPIRQNQGSGNT